MLRAANLFVWRLDERLVEVILSKSLGLALLLGYALLTYGTLRVRAFRSNNVLSALSIGIGRIAALFVITYGEQIAARPPRRARGTSRSEDRTPRRTRLCPAACLRECAYRSNGRGLVPWTVARRLSAASGIPVGQPRPGCSFCRLAFGVADQTRVDRRGDSSGLPPVNRPRCWWPRSVRVVFSHMVHVTGNLWSPINAHIVNNTIQRGTPSQCDGS